MTRKNLGIAFFVLFESGWNQSGFVAKCFLQYQGSLNKLFNFYFPLKSPENYFRGNRSYLICLTLFSQCSLLITLKTLENQRFSDVFQGNQKGTLGRKGLSSLNFKSEIWRRSLNVLYYELDVLRKQIQFFNFSKTKAWPDPEIKTSRHFHNLPRINS